MTIETHCLFCAQSNDNKMTTSTDCGDICVDCLFLTHRQCCECGWWRLKTQYNSTPEDPDYLMCDDCFKHSQ